MGRRTGSIGRINTTLSGGAALGLAALTLGLAMLTLGLAPSAGAVVFGTPLGVRPFPSAPPNWPYDCSVNETQLGPVQDVFGPVGGPATSCIWFDVPTQAEYALFPGRNISPEPPGTGTVTAIRVWVGNTTGPMQIVVMRSLYRNTHTPGKPEDACCLPVARSRVFMPARNAITKVKVSLHVREGPTPPPNNTTTIAAFDTLGLAVLRPGVPVPMYYTGSISAPADLLWNTSAPSTVTPGFYSDSGGLFVAMNATWQPPARR